MVSPGDIFIDATDILNAPKLYMPIHTEARQIEDAILLAADAGMVNTIVTNTSMTNTTPSSYVNVTSIDLAHSNFILANHGLHNGDQIQFNTTGALPAPVVTGKVYYAIVVDVNTFKIATTQVNSVYNNFVVLTAAATGTTSISEISLSQQAYNVFIGQSTDQALTYQLNQIITHFTNLGYTVQRVQNPSSPGIFQWVISWS